MLHHHQILAPYTSPTAFGSQSPRPPNFFGRLTFSQLTRENFYLLPLPAHRKLHWRFLISLSTDLGADSTERRYIGIAWITDLTRTSLPGRFKGLIAQLDSLLFILSTKSHEEACLIIFCLRGTPRYLVGSLPFWKPKILPMFL